MNMLLCTSKETGLVTTGEQWPLHTARALFEEFFFINEHWVRVVSKQTLSRSSIVGAVHNH